MTARRPLPLRPLPLRTAAASLLALAAAGCTVGPDYARPAPMPLNAAAPPAFKEAQGWTPAKPMDAIDKGAWWSVFGDPVLDGLERKVVVTNQNVAQYAAAYRQAHALVAEARASFFPTLSGSLGATRTGTIGTSGSSLTTTSASGTLVTSSGGGSVSTLDGSLSASWAPDLWGKIRRTVEADAASAQASAADLANAALSAQAELASDYFQLRAYDEQKRLLTETLAAYRRTLQVTQNQYAAGTVARTDVITAQTQVDSTDANLVDVDRSRALLEHAIAVLSGQAPSELTLPPGQMPRTVPTAPAGLPSTLLQRRPDIASAERSVKAANARVGVAVAAYYPNLTLSGSLGTSGSAFADLFKADAAVWSVGSSLSETLIDFGARRAAVREAKAAYDQSVATYRQTVLTAFQGVEDELASLRVLEQEQAVRERAEASARRAQQLALNQYRAGQADITTVITAQATALSAEQATLNVLSSRLTASVSLIQELGGGWAASDLPKS